MPDLLRASLIASCVFGLSTPLWALTLDVEEAQKTLSLWQQAQTDSKHPPVIEWRRPIKPGEKSPLVGILKTQWSIATEEQPLHANEIFVAQVKEQQEKNNLHADGVIDQNTWWHLYDPPMWWKQQELQKASAYWESVLQQEMQRASNAFVVVHLPSQHATLFEKDPASNGFRETMTTRVIVGGVRTPTPTDTIDITGLKYNPTWTPTKNILARHAHDPRWTKRAGLVGRRNADGSWSYTQPAGKNNALGVLKFETNSPKNIYLHDTNERHLFARNVRRYSSGCVRVEDYMDLAEKISGWDKNTLEKNIQAKKTWTQALPAPVRVYFDTSRVQMASDKSWMFFASY